MDSNAHQQAVIADAPSVYRTIFIKAYTTGSKSAGIKAFCLHCVGYTREDIRNCTSYGCPLYPHRPYQDEE